MTTWMVRSGSGGRWADECRERNIVGIGWQEMGDPLRYSEKAQLQEALHVAFPEYTEGQAASGASQLWRFQKEICKGDSVITYDSGARIYHYGKIVGAPVFSSDDISDLALQRSVEWLADPIQRDDLTPDARNRLGSVLTLFKVPERVALELGSLAMGGRKNTEKADLETSDEEIDVFETVHSEAEQRVADAIAQLSWQEMQELVGALLRSMGYKTEVSREGPDRGKDVVASPDGFGFEQPRIVVEVKHRQRQKMDAAALRSFMGGRHKDDRGLYVSSGGFTKDAYYEADRSNIPLKLMTLEDLAKAVIDNYDRFDSEGRALLPLRRLYWPA